jgi:hypothetical protein
MRRAAAALALAIGFASGALAAEPRTLVVAGFELIEDHPEPALEADHARRIAALDLQLKRGLVDAGLYRLIDTDAAREAVASRRAAHATLYECNGCAQEIGRAAGAELVAVGWVQKVSQLILNVNVEVRDTDSDRVVLTKSVDMRGNNDESWTRALRFMLRDWAERRAANPRYGR